MLMEIYVSMLAMAFGAWFMYMWIWLSSPSLRKKNRDKRDPRCHALVVYDYVDREGNFGVGSVDVWFEAFPLTVSIIRGMEANMKETLNMRNVVINNIIQIVEERENEDSIK